MTVTAVSKRHAAHDYGLSGQETTPRRGLSFFQAGANQVLAIDLEGTEVCRLADCKGNLRVFC